MIQDSPELVAMKLALGQQLAALREAAELGQQHVGHKTGYSRSSIAKAESGRQLLTRDFWKFVGSLAFCTLRLGTARLQSGEIEEAARVIGEGALLATKNRSARLASEVRAARGRLQPWHNLPMVRELDERLVGLGYAEVQD